MSHSNTVESFTLAPGFRTAAVACGLKPSGNLDLALVAADGPCSAAGVFTTNRVKAAPVLYDQAALAENAGGIRAVLTNAGNANACTGEEGIANTRRMAELTAYALRCQPEDVLILSTGVIGRQLPMDKVTQGIAEVTSKVADTAPLQAARAIMTTDTKPKLSTRQFESNGQTVTISGFCKGAAMIHPNMATMLAIITTDAIVEPDMLQAALRAAVGRSFNRISVDGDMSTNDTVLLLASGVSGVTLDSQTLPTFTEALTDMCTDLAKQIVADGEGATKMIEITVTGAQSEAQAHMVADSIARSPLVKTAIHGGDPNWGRILCAAGYSGAPLDQERLRLSFGDEAQRLLAVERGMPTDYDLARAEALFQGNPVLIQLDLGLGDFDATVWTCDLSKEYVDLNALYTT